MRTAFAHTLGALIAGAGLAACNTSQPGETGLVLFTPRDCGNPLLGCDFVRPVATGASLNVQIMGNGGTSTAGFDLESNNPEILAVTKIADVDGRPTWALAGGRAGSVYLAAVDEAGAQVDFIDVTVRRPTRLGLVKVAGEAVGPTNEDGVDQAWTVNADAPVSFQALPHDGTTQLMGILDYVLVVPQGSTLLASEQSSSDRATGYLYVQPPAGDYPFTFELAAPDSAVAVDAILHAR